MKNGMFESYKGIPKASLAISLKARISLIVLWIVAFLICLSLLFINNSWVLHPDINNDINNSTTGNIKNKEISEEVQGEKDASIFLSTSKKFFLTRTPSSQTVETQNEVRPVNVIILRRKKLNNTSTKDNFEIKQLPN